MRNQKPETRNQNKKQGLVFVISGPSGSGKTTLVNHLLKNARLKSQLVRSISLTTRPKRSKEKQGKDYFFISQDDFGWRRKEKKILEWTRYLGYYYATPKDFLEKRLAQGKNIVLCLDLKGAAKIKKLYPQNSVTFFIKPPSLKELEERIEKRCSETKKEEIRRRLLLAKEELLAFQTYDYSIANRDFQDTLQKLSKILLEEINNNSSKV